MFPMSIRNCNCLIVPQNGVADGQLFGSRQPMLNATSSTMATLNGSAASSNGQKRPKKLEVTSMNAYAPKCFLEDSDDIDDGSLPCTPEIQLNSEIPSGHAGDEVVENDTRQLISSFFRKFVGLSKNEWLESKTQATMKRVVDDVLDKHRYAFNGMINKLSLTTHGDDMTFIGRVAESLFSDGTTNWGRIASLVAFGALVCQHLKENGREHCIELVSNEISSYLLTHQRYWLIKNNAWEGFTEFFQVSDPESTVRNTLMAVVGVAGLSAAFALLTR